MTIETKNKGPIKPEHDHGPHTSVMPALMLPENLLPEAEHESSRSVKMILEAVRGRFVYQGITNGELTSKSYVKLTLLSPSHTQLLILERRQIFEKVEEEPPGCSVQMIRLAFPDAFRKPPKSRRVVVIRIELKASDDDKAMDFVTVGSLDLYPHSIPETVATLSDDPFAREYLLPINHATDLARGIREWNEREESA